MLKPDYVFASYGSVWLVRPTSTHAREQLARAVDSEAQWFGGALAVEPRYVPGLAQQLQDDGWTVSRA